jgi:hypothetical protein
VLLAPGRAFRSDLAHYYHSGSASKPRRLAFLRVYGQPGASTEHFECNRLGEARAHKPTQAPYSGLWWRLVRNWLRRGLSRVWRRWPWIGLAIHAVSAFHDTEADVLSEAKCGADGFVEADGYRRTTSKLVTASQ